MEDDLRRGSHLSPSLYRLVRYEDLIKEPVTVMRDLYQFIGVNVTEIMVQKIEQHFHAENISRPIRQVNIKEWVEFKSTQLRKKL